MVVFSMKYGRTDQVYWEKGRITFLTADGQWNSGIIERLTDDSLYLTKEVLWYSMMGIDTQHFSGFRYAYPEIVALPSKREMVVNKNGTVKVIYGHEKYAWVRNGFIFRVLGGGYAALNITNTLIDGKLPFGRKNLPRLALAAGVFAVGVYLKSRFYTHRKIGGKYTLEARDY